MDLHTRRLILRLQTPEEVRATIAAMDDAGRAQLSADWLARLHEAAVADPWVHGFRLLHADTGAGFGTCGFKGPPVEGVVEIAYGVDFDQQGRGYATEAARALVAYAFGGGDVHLVRAHTLPDAAASKRVLEKCGFRYVGDVVDPEDGLVSRFEKQADGLPVGRISVAGGASPVR